jgi:cell division septum initiation protein DivIVA
MRERPPRRVDELLTELVELVETARAVPMSGSCVVPRERTLDLLDDLRETVPTELGQARELLARRDALLAEAHEYGSQLVHDAEVRAHEIVEAGKAEHAELVSASRVHQAATEHAAQVREQLAEEVAERRAGAEGYSTAVRADAEAFADRTLSDLVDVLEQALATTQQGRQALGERSNPANPSISG